MDKSVTRRPRHLRVSLERARALTQARENLIDCDIVVEDARHELHGVLARLRRAVAARDAEARRLVVMIDDCTDGDRPQ
jgi:hypothetical protein